MAQGPSSQWAAAGFKPGSFNTSVPQAGTLTNCATPYSIIKYVLHQVTKGFFAKSLKLSWKGSFLE